MHTYKYLVLDPKDLVQKVQIAPKGPTALLGTSLSKDRPGRRLSFQVVMLRKPGA